MNRRQATLPRLRLSLATRCLSIVCVLAFSCALLATRVDARCQDAASSASTQVTALTPLQSKIEFERARLASADAAVRRDAVLRLGALGRPEGSRVAAVALTDSAALVRATATRAILSLPSAEAVVLLIPLLADRDEFVRRETAYALGKTGDPKAVPALINALDRDREAGVRGAAAVALGEIGESSAVPALAEAIVRRAPGFARRTTRRRAENNEFVQRSAARALGEIGGSAAVPTLIAALSNDRTTDDVRREAARALGRIGDVTAIPALRAALTARDPYLSRLAYEALRKLDPATPPRPA